MDETLTVHCWRISGSMWDDQICIIVKAKERDWQEIKFPLTLAFFYFFICTQYFTHFDLLIWWYNLNDLFPVFTGKWRPHPVKGEVFPVKEKAFLLFYCFAFFFLLKIFPQTSSCVDLDAHNISSGRTGSSLLSCCYCICTHLYWSKLIHCIAIVL